MSITLSQFQRLIMELGPFEPRIESIQQDEQDEWDILWEDGIEISLSFLESPSRVIFSLLIGRPDEHCAHEVYVSMLCLNLLLATEDSLRIAMVSPNSDLMLIGEFTQDFWTLNGLRDYLERFIVAARSVAENLSSSTPDEFLSDASSSIAISHLSV